MMEWLAQINAARLSFLDPRWSTLEAWQKIARPAMRDSLVDRSYGQPVEAEWLSREERAGFTVETVQLRVTPTYSIPARILIPNDRRGRMPAVLALHCHSGEYTWGHEKVLSSPGESAQLTVFRNGTYGCPWTEELVKRGYLVITIDAFYFGARRLRVEDLDPERVVAEVRSACEIACRTTPESSEWRTAINRVCAHYEHLTAKTLLATGSSWPGLLLADDLRTVDDLISRPDVDPERIGCVGLSGGGFRTALLIAADERIRAAVVTGWMTEFSALLRNHVCQHTWMVYPPGLLRLLDLPDAAGLHAPGALLVQQCRHDELYPLAGMQGAVEKLTRIYAKAGHIEKFRGSFHDVTHCFNPAMQNEAFDWLDRWL